ncbi:MAG: TlpA family protein disulfide reductase [Candidatus Dadabacteria bacterium]
MRVLLLFLLVAALQLTALSQAKTIKPTQRSIVKDSAGNVYPFADWQMLMFHGYTTKPVNPTDKKTDFLLVKLTEEELEKRDESMPKPPESSSFKTGKAIKLFKTTDINGNLVDLSALHGQVVVLNFWFINCMPCRMEIPDLNKLAIEYKDNKNVVFIAVALDYKSDIWNFLPQMPFLYTIIDNGKSIANQYGVRLFPTNLVVGPENKVYYHSSGYAMNQAYWLRKTIKELLQGNTAHK